MSELDEENEKLKELNQKLRKSIVEISILAEKISPQDYALYFLAENIVDGWWDWHIQDNYQYTSPRFWEVMGYNPENKKPSSSEWMDVIHPKDLDAVIRNIERHFKSNGVEPYEQEVRCNHKNGKTIWLRCKGQVIEWDLNGDPVRMIGIHTDITHLKE